MRQIVKSVLIIFCLVDFITAVDITHFGAVPSDNIDDTENKAICFYLLGDFYLKSGNTNNVK